MKKSNSFSELMSRSDWNYVMLTLRCFQDKLTINLGSLFKHIFFPFTL